MSLSDLIRGKSEPVAFSTATPATFATQEGEKGRTVATVAVAKSPQGQTAPPAKVPVAVAERGADADPFAVVRAWRRMRAAGFEIRINGDSLQVSPADQLADPQRAYIRAHKLAMVALLGDAETLYEALQEAGTAGLGWREGTPADWSSDKLLAAGEVLYADGRMVNRMDRRYLTTSAPAAIEAGPDISPDKQPDIRPVVLPMDREAYEERAAIMEYEGGLPRDEAERKALALAIRAQELRAEGWAPQNAKARAESEALPGWESPP